MECDFSKIMYIKRSVFYKVLYTYILALTGFNIIFFILKCDRRVILAVSTATIYVGVYLFISSLKIPSNNVILLKVHLIFSIIYFIGIILSDSSSFTGRVMYFDLSKGLVYESVLYLTLTLHYIIKNIKGSKTKIIDYFNLIAINVFPMVINYYKNIKAIDFIINDLLVYLMFILSIVLLLSMLWQIRDGVHPLAENINIFKMCIISFLLLDSVAIIIRNIYISYYVNILIFAIFNICLLVYIYNLNIVNNDVKLSGRYDYNQILEKSNKDIIKKNNDLEIKKNKLIERNRLYNEFLKIVSIPIVVISRDNHRVLYSNDIFLNLCEEKNFKGIINQKISRFVNFENKIDRTESGLSGNVIGYKEINGETKIFDINYVGYSQYEVALLFNDITEKERIESVKNKLERRRVDERIKDNFLSNISHDLKTPIGVIYSAIQLENFYLKENNENEVKKYNLICRDNCLYLTRLTNNLLDITRITEKSLKPKYVNENIVYFIEETVNCFIDFAKSNNNNVVFDTEEEEIFINFDKEFTERIIINLLSNALKYSKPNSTIFINIINEVDTIRVEVKDQGVGMSREFLKQAFEMYAMEREQDNQSKKGTGIGLFVVYNLAQLQGASVEVQSEIGQGSTFSVNFKKG